MSSASALLGSKSPRDSGVAMAKTVPRGPKLQANENNRSLVGFACPDGWSFLGVLKRTAHKSCFVATPS
jgi:hypothetical protein